MAAWGIFAAATVVAIAFSLIAGCGSGSKEVGNVSSTRATAVGQARFSVVWPKRDPMNGRLIPAAANSIQLVITSPDGKQQLGSALIARPADGSPASATINGIPVGSALATADAYPNADGSGIAQATATVPVAIVQNAVVPVSLTMASTITTLDLLPTSATVSIGGTYTFEVSPLDAAGNVVLVATGDLSWTSSATTVATVSAGIATGVSDGNATITVTEKDSGTSATGTVTVTGGPTPTPPLHATLKFAPSVSYACPGAGGTIVSGDFDGDGNQDVAIASNQNVVIYYGKGDGTLGAPVTIFTSTDSPNPQAAADFNKDGKLDIVCSSSSGNMYVLLNAGNRTFQPITVPVDGPTISVTVADFDGNGYPDFAAVIHNDDESNGKVDIVLNTGGSSFTLGTAINFGWIPLGVTAGDLNGDGKPDLIVTIVTDIVGESGVNLFFGQGDGTFTAGGSYNTGTENVNFARIADVNGDGRPDMVVGDFTDNNVTVLFGAGKGNFGGSTTYSDPPYPADCRLTDLDGNGYPEIVTVNSLTSNVSILQNNGDGTFMPRVVFPATGISNAEGCATPDLNNDGQPDIVASGNNLLVVLINQTR